MDIKILIDDRERIELRSFDKSVCEILRLEVGDFILVVNDKPIICLERKTLADLAASIKDGRTANVIKMYEYGKLHNCKIFYAIETKELPVDSNLEIAGIKYSTMRGHLDRIMFRYDVHVEYVEDKMDIIDRLIELGENWIKLQDKMEDYEKKEMEHSVKTGGSSVEIQEFHYIKLLQAFSGIGEKMSLKIAEHKFSAADIFAEPAKVAKKIEMTPKRMEKFVNAVVDPINSGVWINVLIEIPGIGKITATALNETEVFKNIVYNKISCDDLKNFVIGNGKLGINKANNIINYLHYKKIGT